ncbi:MAG: hypothetical protein ABR585_14820, partial [Gemmatimonadaceae bacterium]
EGVWGMPPEMVQTLFGYGPDVAKNRAEAREIMQKLGGSYWVPGWWEEVWVACPQGLCDSRRGRREPAIGREDLRIWRHRIWSTSWH